MNILDILKETIAEKSADWSEEDKTLAITISTDLAGLFAREAAGEDVPDEELDMAKAAARNIAAGAAFTEALGRVLNQLLARFTL